MVACDYCERWFHIKCVGEEAKDLEKFCCNKCKCENKDEIEKLASEVADLEERMEKYKTITEGSTDQVTRLKNEMKVMRRETAKLKEEKEDKEKENHQL